MGSVCGVLIRRIYQSYSTLRRVAQRTSEIPEVSRGWGYSVERTEDNAMGSHTLVLLRLLRA
jgi:hypothetical protein